MVQGRGPAGRDPKSAPDKLIGDSWLIIAGFQEATPSRGRSKNTPNVQQAGKPDSDIGIVALQVLFNA